MTNLSSRSKKNSSPKPFPSILQKVGLLLAVLPFLFYGWDGTSGLDSENIYNIWVLIGGLMALVTVPLVFILEIRKLEQSEKVKHILLMVPVDILGIIHILYGIGMFKDIF